MPWSFWERSCRATQADAASCRLPQSSWGGLPRLPQSSWGGLPRLDYLGLAEGTAGVLGFEVVPRRFDISQTRLPLS